MYTLEQANNFNLGFTKGFEEARKGVDENEALLLETNPDIIEGVKAAYEQYFELKFSDSVKAYKLALESKDKDQIIDASDKLQELSKVRKSYFTSGRPTVPSQINFLDFKEAIEEGIDKIAVPGQTKVRGNSYLGVKLDFPKTIKIHSYKLPLEFAGFVESESGYIACYRPKGGWKDELQVKE